MEVLKLFRSNKQHLKEMHDNCCSSFLINISKQTEEEVKRLLRRIVGVQVGSKFLQLSGFLSTVMNLSMRPSAATLLLSTVLSQQSAADWGKPQKLISACWSRTSQKAAKVQFWVVFKIQIANIWRMWFYVEPVGVTQTDRETLKLMQSC